MSALISPTIQRAIATMLGTFIGGLALKLGVELTEAQLTNITIALVTGAFGLVQFVTLVVKNRIDRKVNPANVADPRTSGGGSLL